MDFTKIKALTVDTGGTVLDWHTGFSKALAAAGQRHGMSRNWAALTNDLRRRSLGLVVNQGKDGKKPEHNFDTAHRAALDSLLADENLDVFDDADRKAIAWDAPHGFRAWPDMRAGLAALRERIPAVSFTLLSYRLVIDSSRVNGLSWDAIISCEGLGVYKTLPEAYLGCAARLQLDPAECMMVACHAFDLDAAKSCGFATALVRRPDEWGDTGDRPELPPAGTYDIEVDGFTELAEIIANPPHKG